MKIICLILVIINSSSGEIMKKIILIFFIMTLAGCNTGQYQSYQSGIGYQSENRTENIYRVSYTGTRTTKIDKVNDFAMLRSAELTLENGYSHFAIISAENNENAAQNKTDMSARTLTGVSGGNSPTGGVGASASTLNMGAEISGPKSKSDLTIVMYNEKPLGISYDASRIVRALRQEYGITTEP